MALQVVVFSLGREDYGIPIDDVQEITRLEKIYPLPQAPLEIQGLIRIRGQAIPLINLNKKFAVQQVKEPEYAIIIEVKDRLVAFAVEEVKEVKTFEAVAPPPMLVNSNLIRGLINLPEGIIILLEPQGILNEEEMTNLGDWLDKVR
ncbi:MAG: chemotaxis protein CheW [Desulfitobacteriia bacterium]|jgi:purine-binding chemotaxis protein CheW